MRRPLAHVLAAVCALVFGATPALASAPAVPSGAGGIIPSPLPPGQQPRGLRPDPAICPSGAEQCVDSIVARMQRAYGAAGCSHNAAFSLLYLDTTLQIRDAIRHPENYTAPPFSDRRFWNRVTDTFGTYYLDSYQHWVKGEDSRVPEAWKIAFDDAASGKTSTLGDLFLGINAHVNRDLAYVYYQTGADNKEDHERVNDALNLAAGVAYPDIAAHLDPRVLTELRSVPAGVDLDIFRWRDEAWDNAERLRDATTPAERATISAEIDANARQHAEQIEKAFPATDQENAERDGFCAAHR
ncbi:MAG: DUF5995 family protein [Marmoricola sp.]